MIKIYHYQNDYKDKWNDFIANSKNGIFMFNRDFMDYHSDRFKDNSLMFYDEEKLIAVLPANIKENILYSHGGLTYGGFITDEKMKQHKMMECFKIFKKYMSENNIKKCIYKVIPHIYHKLPSEEDLYALFKFGAKSYRQDVSTTISLLKPCQMPKGRKAQISRAKREGVIIEESNDFEIFIELENSVLKTNHGVKAVHSAEELKLLKSRFQNKIQLWISKYNNEIIAGTLLFVYDNVVHTQYMAANEKAREIGALDLLIKTLIDKYKDEKQYFDFGISTENDGKYLNEGLIAQKESFGGRSIIYSFYELSAED